MKIILVLCALLTVFTASLSFSQTNTTDSLTVTTYFPSPNAVFSNMEIKAKIIVGNITDSNTPGIASVNDVPTNRVYVTNSIRLGPLLTQPTAPRLGQLFYNSSAGKLEFYNGTWQKFGE